MNRDDFEAKVLEMWMKTRIPMTRANLQYWTGTSRKLLNKRLDELAADGILEVDVGDDAEMVWSVPGATRSLDGPTSFADHDRREGMRAAARQKVAASRGRSAVDDGLSTAMTLARSAGLAGQERSRDRKALTASGDGEKSALVGAGLGLLGPLGWLYAGSFKETVPAAIAMVLIVKFVPTFLLMWLMPILLPLSALVGGIYAWQYNRAGERQTLFLDDGKDDAPKKR